MNKKMPRILLAGANSGCGKTSITCGILKALTKRGIQVQSYKCGPDYIDPMLHSHITGRSCRNLDPFFSTEEDLRELVAKDSRLADFSVTEGVMGYYDGVGVSCEKSTHTVSVATKTPTILIFNVKGMSHTMIPLMKGMLEYRENPVVGVILNRCTKGLYQMMKPEIERILGIECVGYFPYKDGMSIGSRHLGLMTAAEIQNLDEVLERLGETAEEGIDLERILALGEQAAELSWEDNTEDRKKESRNLLIDDKYEESQTLPIADKPEESRNLPIDDKSEVSKRVRIAVAWDKAFCFYYKENLEILEQLGAELVYFSPVNDEKLPESICGIYLGGGYPETYRRELSENLSMKASILDAVGQGKPVIAECGGFMYVCDHLIETDDSTMPMLGIIPTDVQMTKRLSMQFGYVTMEALKDSTFLRKGEKIRVHEFHYSKAMQRGDSCRMTKYSGKNWTGVYTMGHVMAGYPHLYFHNCRQVVARFIECARDFC